MNHLSLDVFDDLNVEKTFTKIASKLPEDLRKINLMTSETRDTLPDRDFALSVVTKTASKLNKFPINDKLNTALSNFYFDMNHGSLPLEAQKLAASHIKTACLRQGISPTKAVSLLGKEPTVSNLFIEKVGHVPGGRSYVPGASHGGVYALEKKAGANHIRRYPISSPELLNKAVGYFEKYAKEFSPEDRYQFANNVSVQAKNLGLSIASPMIDKYAGNGYSPELQDHLNIRKRLEPTIAGALDKLASMKNDITPKEFADALYEVDKHGGYTNQYDRFIADPYQATFAKVAHGYLYEEDGIALDELKLKEVFENKYKQIVDHFGSSLADALKKDGFPIFDSLPKDAKQVIARIATGEIT